MKNIYLVQAGKFLLGINAATIISILDQENFIQGKQKGKSLVLHLESFLAQESLTLPNSEWVLLEVENGSGPLFLLVDRVSEEIETPDQFEPLPLLYPKLAEICCPQVFIHDDQVVLLLEAQKISSVRKKLQAEYGFVSLDELLDVKEAQVEDKETAHQELCEKVVGHKSSLRCESDPSSTAPDDIILPSDHTDNSSAEEEPTQSTLEINDENFRKIVSWTIGRYIECDCNGEVIINANELPSRIIQRPRLSNKIVQHLINKTVQRCEKINNEALLSVLVAKISGKSKT